MKYMEDHLRETRKVQILWVKLYKFLILSNQDLSIIYLYIRRVTEVFMLRENQISISFLVVLMYSQQCSFVYSGKEMTYSLLPSLSANYLYWNFIIFKNNMNQEKNLSTLRFLFFCESLLNIICVNRFDNIKMILNNNSTMSLLISLLRTNSWPLLLNPFNNACIF